MAIQLHELSDDEISKLTPDQINEMVGSEANQSNTDAGLESDNDDPEDKESNPVLNAEEKETVVVPKAEVKQDNPNEDPEDKAKAKVDGAETNKVVDAPVVDGKKDDQGKSKVDPEAKVDTPVKVDYEAEYKNLLAPFKANGREIQVANVDEARQLMSMGANYNKKMQAMKPHLSTLRTLENAKIGEAELSYLIDLHRKDPAAINKLVKESGIDPLDLSAEKADDYRPGNHKPSDVEIELETVLAELDGSEGLPKTIDIVTTKWDNKSKEVIARNPNVLKLINGHVESGIYDLVANEVERKRTFGQLSGLSDFDAYRQVGDEMNAGGKFAHLTGSSPQGQQTPAAQIIEAPNPKKADDDKRKEQKREAAPAKAVVTTPKNPDFNPLSMSDEEFAKLSIKT